MQNTKSLTELLSRHEYKAGTVEDQNRVRKGEF